MLMPRDDAAVDDIEKVGESMTYLLLPCDKGGRESADERALAAFTRRVIEIAALSRAAAGDPALEAPLDILTQPAFLLDLDGLVIGANKAAEAMADNDVRLRQRRLYIRDPEARHEFRLCAGQCGDASRRVAPGNDPIIVPRQDRLPFLMRIWPLEPSARWPSRDARALVTLNALGPRPGPPAAVLAKTFSLTPSEAKLACIIARGAGPDTAAAELHISRETARNQLKSIFAKTATHRQGELVALLLQV